MKTLPASPDISRLKKQSKQLLKAARAENSEAIARFVEALPSLRDGVAPTANVLRLHNAQSVIAREYGFPSWPQLKRYVEWKRGDRAERLASWLRLVLEGNAARRRLAMRMMDEEPDLFAGDPWVACVLGDLSALRGVLDRDPPFAVKTGGPLAMPPLVAVAHSKLVLDGDREDGLLASARLLIDHGADVNGRWSDPQYRDSSLSPLYGAAGVTHHAGMTKLLLDAGADPDDNESLYHSMETGDLACTRLLLEAGATVPGTNAVGRALDYDRLDALKLLIDHGGDPNENVWLHHAILRGRSLEHIRLLFEAGGDIRAENREGVSVFRWAMLHGREDVVTWLRGLGVEERPSDEERFVAACTRGGEAAARSILADHPDMLSRLSKPQLRMLPQLAGIGAIDAVRTMLAVGWPREVKAGWHATALNHAVFQGDAAMTRLIMQAGADWRTQHGFGDNVLGTLSFASNAEDIADPAPLDYVGCAEALVEGGVPVEAFDDYVFSPEVAAWLETA